ncbi:MAG: formyltransferase family protein [Bacteroidales bacterium]|nr:formyltransferase family protein [Bacteroidales bacterium]
MNCSKEIFEIVVFSSGGGGNFQSLIDHQAEFDYSISQLVVDRDCGAINRAERHQIPVFSFNIDSLGDRFFYEIDASIPYTTNLIVLAGFFPILPDWFCAKWQNKIINTHPSLLPKFGGKGMYGVKVQEAVLAANEKEAGCTVHFVDSGIDTGEIILQKSIAVVENETAWNLGGRVFDEEVKLLPLAVKMIKDQYILDTKSQPKILVSICCLVYNHSQYLEQCIQGFLNQKTNFDFEILLHDDASTDNSTKIISDYQEKYPDIIKPIYQTQNQFSKGISVSKTFQFPRAKGKYIAMCEGDDYWIDSLKLQKQVDFLEANDDFGLIHTDCNLYYQHSNSLVEAVNSATTSNKIYDISRELNVSEAILIGSYKIRTSTVLFKKDLYFKSVENDPIAFTSLFKMGDIQIWFGISKLSAVKYLDEVTSVYRINEGTLSREKELKKQLRFQLSSIELRLYYISKYEFSIEFVRFIMLKYNTIFLRYKLHDFNYKAMYPVQKDMLPFNVKILYWITQSKVASNVFGLVENIKFSIENIWNKIKTSLFNNKLQSK